MRHLKTFESYSYSNDESINEEFIGGLLKSILSIQVAVLTVLGVQFLSGRLIYAAVKNDLLDVYSNIDVLIDLLERLSLRRDITDVEMKKINKRLKELKKIKDKYPTLDDYKKRVYKTALLLNIKNKNYLKNQIMDYEPRVLSAHEVLEKLRKIYKEANASDVGGYGNRGRNDLQDRLNDMLNRERGGNIPNDDDFNEY